MIINTLCASEIKEEDTLKCMMYMNTNIVESSFYLFENAIPQLSTIHAANIRELEEKKPSR